MVLLGKIGKLNMFSITKFDNYLTDFQKNILNEFLKYLEVSNNYQISFNDDSELIITNKTFEYIKNIIIFDCENFAISIIYKKGFNALNFYSDVSEIPNVVKLFMAKK